MTSSEPPAPHTGSLPAAPPIAAGHLHPGMLFLRFLDGIRQALLPLGLALVTQQVWLLVVVGMYFVLAMGFALARYLTFEYRLTADELVTTEGILHRQERRIPVNRIQDVSFESTIIRRICGLVVVSVETASSQGAEAKLDSVSRIAAEHLREALYRTRAAGDDPAGEAPPLPPEYLLFRSSPADLFFRGLTDNRIGVILASLFGVYELAYEFGLGAHVGGVFGQFAGWLSGAHWALLAGVVFAVVFVALLGGWVVSIATSFLLFFNFHLTVRDDVFQRRYGLITTRAASLPRRKIQRVSIESTFLRRLFGLAVLRADSAGSGMDPTEELRGGRDVVVPLAEIRVLEPLVPVLLPDLASGRVDWQRVSPRVVVRIFFKGVFLAAVLTAALASTVGWWALCALVLLPVAWGVGVLSFQNLAYSEIGGHLALRWGILGRYRAVVPLRKLQGVVVRATPVDRILALSSLTVYVAGGSPTALANLPADEARALQRRLVQRAAASRFVW